MISVLILWSTTNNDWWQIKVRFGILLYERILIDDASIEIKRNETIVGILSTKKLSIFFIIPNDFE